MINSIQNPRRLLVTAAIAGAAIVAGCKEPVGVAEATPPAPPATETAVRATIGAKSALANSTVDAMTVETRYWNSAPWVLVSGGFTTWIRPEPRGLAARSTFEALPRDVPGYTNRPIELPTLKCANIEPGVMGTPPDFEDFSLPYYSSCLRNPGDGTTAAFRDLATRYRARVTTTARTDFRVRWALDVAGGVLIVDGVVVDQKWNDPFWNGYFDIENGEPDASGTYTPRIETDTSVVLAAAFNWNPNTTHIIEVIGFENGADFGNSAQFNDGGGWTDAVAMVPPYRVALNVSVGAGGGRVTSAPAGINCGTTCAASFAWATMPALTAVPDQYFVFSGWSRDCSGTGDCAPFVETPKSVTATFTRVAWPLQVTRAGTGSGTVSSADNVINCGTTCLAGFPVNSTVTLTAVGSANSDFAGWSGGGCSGTGSCTVTMDRVRNITATFNLKRFALTVVKSGTGTGSVASSPAGITCGSACTAQFTVGTSVTLTATAGVGSIFTGWSGPCSGTAPTCVVSMGSAQTATANFALRTFVLAVSAAGTGSGVVTSSVGGINCGTACTATLDYATPVTLTATPATGSVFAGWSGGGCTGTGTCTVAMSQAQAVTATFNLRPIGDFDPPVISCKATPNVLWPVNHKMHDIRVRVTLTDAGAGADGFQLVSVMSNEPVNGRSDGNTSYDIAGWTLNTADVTGQLRAERAGTLRDRIYALTYRGFDKAGNSATTTCTVVVPHDQRSGDSHNDHDHDSNGNCRDKDDKDKDKDKDKDDKKDKDGKKP